MGPATALPAVGWRHGFQSVAETLNLPPGWRLLHASGVDGTPLTWVSRWSLLDLFLVLILSLATARLFGWGFGALALVTLVLVYPELDAPRWIFAFVLAGEALYRVVPAGWLKRVTGVYRLTTWVILVAMTVPFLVKQVRGGTYPVLVHPYRSVATGDSNRPGGVLDNLRRLNGASAEALAGKAAPPPPQERDQASKRRAKPRLQGPSSFSSSAGSGSDTWRYQVAPDAAIQTGPGLPAWRWDTVALTWRGPVAASQQVHLYLLSPAVNLVLALARVLLLVALVGVLLGGPKRRWPRFLRGRGAAATAAAILVALLPLAARAQGTIPSDETLATLRQRLLAPPDCSPTCASVPRLDLLATPSTLTLRLEVDAAARTAVPLPGDAAHFVPTEVTVDGRPADRLARDDDGTLWLGLDAGRHHLVVSGPLPDQASVQLPLPLHPGRTTARVTGWTVVGLEDGGVADATVELDRIRQATGAPGQPLEPGVMPGFATVTRNLHLGLDWTVQTRVVRQTAPGSALVLEVPLLPGESVTTPGVRVKDGQVQVNLAASEARFTWTSTLQPAKTLTLTAPKTTRFTEIWAVDASPVWHLTATGIPPVHTGATTPARYYEPWPGESLTLTVVRPEAVAGRSLTLDRVRLEASPGLRATDATLSLTVRSSRGGPHAVTLPVGATLQSLRVTGGGEVPVRQEGRKVTLPLTPGRTDVVLKWREARGIGARFVTPQVDLGADGVNAQVQLRVPQDRWILFASGPRAGPAVLFWSLLAVVLIVAVLLGRVKDSPLKTWEWILLGIGLTQVSIWLGLLVAGWLLALGRRRARPEVGPAWFDLRQVGLAGWTAVALVALFLVVRQGLLGHPSMQLSGNGSSRYLLQWYQDRVASALPTATVISVPLMVYRVAMLLWALWLAAALVKWLRFGWLAFGAGGLWRKVPVKVPAKAAAGAAGGAAPVPATPAPVDPPDKA